jgi:predicted transcriptional regulator
MSPTIEKAIAALEAMPEEMRENAVAHLVRQADKFKQLQAEIQLGLDDVEAGRVVPWDPEDFLKRAREASSR